MGTTMSVTPSAKLSESLRVEHGYGTRFQGFQNLMRYRIRDVLLVSSLYDLYVFEEDGRLYELIRNEYQGLNLSHAPEITRVARGDEALTLAGDEKRFDLIITTQHIEDMDAIRLASEIKKRNLDIPIVLLAYDNRELVELVTHSDTSVFDRIFIWTGNFRIIVAIIKHLEDRMNVAEDTQQVGVQTIILIEDSVRYYSAFLPMLYTEILKQSQRLISEGINLTHKYLRMRARPKILLCSTYEEAWDYYTRYEEYILGIISDIDFLHKSRQDKQAGIHFARAVKARQPDIPIMLQSTEFENEGLVQQCGAEFALKDSPNLLEQLRHFTARNFGFGDFIFRVSDGSEVARASNLYELEQQLKAVPVESIVWHAEKNHFSNWLKARTEFWLAHKLRPRKVSDYNSPDELREDLVWALREYRKIQQRGIITDFHKDTFDPVSGFARLGGGSLGGKARGLSFLNTLINNYRVQDHFEGVHVAVPPAIVLGTDVFDAFMDENNLWSQALNSASDEEITKIFLKARRFPEEILGELAGFLDTMNDPLAVRSSSLLEDSQYHPFAGVYETYMLPNNNPDPLSRLGDLLNAIRRVYASTYYQATKDYIKITSYRLEEEKMAVIIQRMVGSRHEERFYPDFSGVARSYNFYPVAPQTSQDGIVSLALGLGKTVVDGGNTVRFSPRYPNHLPQFTTVDETLRISQNEFYALDLSGVTAENFITHDTQVKTYRLTVAEKDGTLNYAGSTYSPENHHVYDGISRQGIRLITFAPLLKHKIFPIAEILQLLLEMGSWGMGTPVEIEFAVQMHTASEAPSYFGVLQMRPLVLNREAELLKIGDFGRHSLICESHSVMGNGLIDDIFDIVYVDFHRFERSRSRDVAREVALLNSRLVSARRPYILIGVGRWGTLDPWLGIPVAWDQISGAKAIVESSFKNFMVSPSQGSHFFQNLTSFMIGYFTVNPHKNDGYVDWKWLNAQPAETELEFTRHLHLAKPVRVRMNGSENKGIILKPEIEPC